MNQINTSVFANRRFTVLTICAPLCADTKEQEMPANDESQKARKPWPVWPVTATERNGGQVVMV